MRVLILGTYRDSELSNADALVDALAALRRLEVSPGSTSPAWTTPG